jgi:hypothetical protein
VVVEHPAKQGIGTMKAIPERKFVAIRRFHSSPRVLWKSLGLVMRDVSESSTVAFPNPLDLPIFNQWRFVRKVYIPSKSHISRSESKRGGYTV